MKTTRARYNQHFYLFIGFLFLVTLYGWYEGQQFNLDKSQTLRYLGQITGIFGLVLMSVNYLLAARFKFLEKIFGSLDKMYRLHMFAGIGSYFMVLLHPIFLSLRFLDDSSIIKTYFIPFLNDSSLARNLGISGFWMLTILIFISGSRKLPYKYWKVTHSFIGIPLILGGAHSLLVSNSIQNSLVLGLWIVFWTVFGTYCYVYKVFLYEYIGPSFKYRIVDIKDFDELREFYMEPIGKKMNYFPGQFAFIKFYSKGVSTEEHPFTMSSAPTDDFLRFSVKKLGDWSSKLSTVSVGDKVKVMGPYGHFNERFLRDCNKQIWIGGGIGITPFLSMARYELVKPTCAEVHLIYSDNTPEQSVFKDEITSYANREKNLNVIIHYSDTQGYLSADVIEEWVGNLEGALFMFCGPAPMTNSVSKQLIENKNIPKEDIVYEYFNFK